jgi:DNA-binding MarR family transcriptional regulator
MAVKTKLDTSYLEALLGYNTRRATLTIVSHFMEQMSPFELRPTDFSVLSLIRHNPGITASQLCSELNILKPNLVVFLKDFENRNLISRKPHLTDGRAMRLSLTPAGEKLMAKAEATAVESDLSISTALTERERETLKRLLQKIYL